MNHVQAISYVLVLQSSIALRKSKSQLKLPEELDLPPIHSFIPSLQSLMH